jgi:hypothetical protein
MSGVTITATFGKKEAIRNGLDVIADDLSNEQPPERHYVIGVVECVRVDVNRLKGDEKTPAVRFVAIEAALTDADVKTARSLFERRYMKRTGQGNTDELALDFSHPSDEDAEETEV